MNNIQVAIKVKPILDNQSSYWKIKENSLFNVNGGDCFSFDHVFCGETTNEELYDQLIHPIVQSAINGINGSVFAYGQTASGKTHTMSGTRTLPGIVQIAFKNLFELIKYSSHRCFLLRASYMEIYNEKVIDLLNPSKEVKIHEDLSGNVMPSVTEDVVDTVDHLCKVLRSGERNRRVGITNMNERSSRSHTIFRVIIESRESSDESEDVIQIAHLNFIDLAGSERADQTGATGMRFKEGSYINKSLSTLSLVIKNLSEQNQFINYRDSKLTRILQSSLGGNSKTIMICTITPSVVEETNSTLAFASRAKCVKTNPHVNEVHSSDSLLKKYAKQVTKLKEDQQKAILANERLVERIAVLEKNLLTSHTVSVKNDNKRRYTWNGPALPKCSNIPDTFYNPDVSVISKDIDLSFFETPLEDFELELIRAEKLKLTEEFEMKNERVSSSGFEKINEEQGSCSDIEITNEEEIPSSGIQITNEEQMSSSIEIYDKRMPSPKTSKSPEHRSPKTETIASLQERLRFCQEEYDSLVSFQKTECEIVCSEKIAEFGEEICRLQSEKENLQEELERDRKKIEEIESELVFYKDFKNLSANSNSIVDKYDLETLQTLYESERKHNIVLRQMLDRYKRVHVPNTIAESLDEEAYNELIEKDAEIARSQELICEFQDTMQYLIADTEELWGQVQAVYDENDVLKEERIILIDKLNKKETELMTDDLTSFTKTNEQPEMLSVLTQTVEEEIKPEMRSLETQTEQKEAATIYTATDDLICRKTVFTETNERPEMLSVLTQTVEEEKGPQMRSLETQTEQRETETVCTATDDLICRKNVFTETNERPEMLSVLTQTVEEEKRPQMRSLEAQTEQRETETVCTATDDLICRKNVFTETNERPEMLSVLTQTVEEEKRRQMRSLETQTEQRETETVCTATDDLICRKTVFTETNEKPEMRSLETQTEQKEAATIYTATDDLICRKNVFTETNEIPEMKSLETQTELKEAATICTATDDLICRKTVFTETNEKPQMKNTVTQTKEKEKMAAYTATDDLVYKKTVSTETSKKPEMKFASTQTAREEKTQKIKSRLSGSAQKLVSTKTADTKPTYGNKTIETESPLTSKFSHITSRKRLNNTTSQMDFTNVETSMKIDTKLIASTTDFEIVSPVRDCSPKLKSIKDNIKSRRHSLVDNRRQLTESDTESVSDQIVGMDQIDIDSTICNDKHNADVLQTVKDNSKTKRHSLVDSRRQLTESDTKSASERKYMEKAVNTDSDSVTRSKLNNDLMLYKNQLSRVQKELESCKQELLTNNSSLQSNLLTKTKQLEESKLNLEASQKTVNDLQNKIVDQNIQIHRLDFKRQSISEAYKKTIASLKAEISDKEEQLKQAKMEIEKQKVAAANKITQQKSTFTQTDSRFSQQEYQRSDVISMGSELFGFIDQTEKIKQLEAALKKLKYEYENCKFIARERYDRIIQLEKERKNKTDKENITPIDSE